MNRVYDILAPVLGIGIAAALLCVLIFLSLGWQRKYLIVFVYAAWELVANVGFTVADILYHGTSQTTPATRTAAQLWYARLYWTNDVLVDLFRFVLVIVLIYRAAEGVRRVSGKALAVLVLVMIVLPFPLFHFNTQTASQDFLHVRFPPAKWLNSTSELLNFGAAIMNLMLWGTLIASKRRDPQLLQVSIGLGIVVTGTAMAYGVRHILGEQEFATVGYLLMNLTQLAGWAMWCRAFWPGSRAKKPVGTPVVSR